MISRDNIKGLPKCGPKTAVKIIKQCPTDADLRTALHQSSLELFFRNVKLVDLNQGIIEHPGDVQIYEEQYQNLKALEPDFNKFENICRSYNMSRVTDNIHVWKTAFNRKTLAITLESIVNKLNIK